MVSSINVHIRQPAQRDMWAVGTFVADNLFTYSILVNY